MIKVLVIGAGGFIGAISRYGIGSLLHEQSRHFPWATLFVNIVGCFLIGVVMPRWDNDHVLGFFLATGILGGFTTFSSFGHETHTLMERGRFDLATGYAAASIILGLAAVWLGRFLSTRI